MTKVTVKRIKALLKDTDMQVCLTKLLLECWNNEHPHFGGSMPHRYDGTDKYCAYCQRPKNWVRVNPGVAASDIVYGG